MEAKQTVMGEGQREAFRQKCHRVVADYLGKDIPDIRLSDMDSEAIQICKKVALEELEAQAEITWGKAVGEVVEFIKSEKKCRYINDVLYYPVYEKALKIKEAEWGIKEG